MSDLELIVNAGMGKINMAKNDPKRFFIRSLMAGLYLGGAMIISYTLCVMINTFNPVMGKIALAFSFGIGLAAIVFLGAELFTGNCFSTAICVYDKRVKFTDILPAWFLCFFGNVFAIAFVGFLFIKSGSNFALLKEYLEPVIQAKFVFDPIELFIKGILCNFLVCIAAYSGMKLKSESGKFMMIIAFVGAFVLPGFDHCIANAGLFGMGLTLFGTGIDIPMMLLHLLISCLGNIVGGSVMLGLFVYGIVKK